MIGPTRHHVDINPDIDQKLVEHTLFLAVQYAYSAGVEGDVLEFGTMTGNSADALAQGIAAFDGKMAGRGLKVLHLFDSFKGMPKSASPADTGAPQIRDGMWAPGTAVDLSPAALRERLERVIHRDSLKVHKGWFSDTVPIFYEQVSVVHVDCDLYESTMDALHPLFNKGSIMRGAMILFDDWLFNQANSGHGEHAAWRDLIDRHCIKFSDEGGYGAMGHKFIVHTYK